MQTKSPQSNLPEGRQTGSSSPISIQLAPPFASAGELLALAESRIKQTSSFGRKELWTLAAMVPKPFLSKLYIPGNKVGVRTTEPIFKITPGDPVQIDSIILRAVPGKGWQIQQRRCQQMPHKLLRRVNDDLAKYLLYYRFNGHRYRKVVTCSKEAVKGLDREFVRKAERGYATSGFKFFDKITEYFDWAEAGNKSVESVKTEKLRVKTLKEFFGDCDLTEIDKVRITEYCGLRRKAGKSPGTINRALAWLSFFSNWCIERGYLKENPTPKMLIEPDSRIVILSSRQVRELLYACDPRQKLLVMLGIYTGMRRGEILKLQWSRVDLDNGFIRLEGKDTKAKRNREITMPDDLLKFLQGVRSENPNSVYVIEYKGKPIKSFKKIWLKLRQKLPFAMQEKLRFHDLRHVFATILRMQGTELHEIKELMGHQSLAMTQRYAHFNGRVQRKTVNRIGDYINAENDSESAK